MTIEAQDDDLTSLRRGLEQRKIAHFDPVVPVDRAVVRQAYGLLLELQPGRPVV